MTTLEILEAARALIADKEHWTKGAMARNAWGYPVNPRTTDAVRWCMAGGIHRVCGGVSESLPAIAALRPFTDGLIDDFNDTHTHPEVLAMFDKAIAAERELVEA